MLRVVTALQPSWRGGYTQRVDTESNSFCTLYDLPPELITLVIETLCLDQDVFSPNDPAAPTITEDLLALCRTSSILKGCATPFLYRKVSTLKTPRTCRLLLRTLATKPRLATQIKHLHVKLWTGWTRGGLSLRDRVDILESLPLHVRPLSTHGSLPKLLANGDHDAETAVLIALAVNVESLILQTFIEDDKVPTHSDSDLAMATFAHLTAHGGLPHLRHLHLKHQEGYSRPYMMDVRAHISRLHHRTLDTLIVEDGFSPGETWFAQDAGSAPKLRSLDLANCKVQARATARAICSFTGLRNLTFSCIEYYYRGAVEDWGQVFDILPTHAATLENLRVMAYEPISQPIHFKWNEMVALKSLTIPSDLLLFRSPDTLLEEDPLLYVEGESLAGVLALPRSLEALHVTTTHHLHDLRRMLVTILPAITECMHTLELHFVDEEDTRSAIGDFHGVDSLELDGICLSISSETIKFAYRGSDWNTVSKYCARAQELNSVFEPFLEVGGLCV